MDFFNELYLSALISILLAFLLGKFAAAGDHRPITAGVVESDMSSETVDLVKMRGKESEIEEEKEKEVKIERIEGFEDEEEWQGIERSGVEGLFGEAVKFVGGETGKEIIEKLGKEAQMKLYAFYKVATEGPCYNAPPLAIKLSSRARWNAWQKLGDMNPEIAMEKYVTLLSEYIPNWNKAIKDEDFKAESSSDFSTNINQVALEQIQTKQGLTPAVLLNLLGPPRMNFLTLYL